MKIFVLALPFFLASLALGAISDSLTPEEKNVSGAALSEPLNPDLIKRYDEDVRENPSSCKRRWQRSLVLLKHGQFNEHTSEDIDTLFLHPLWRTQGERLKALLLYLQGDTGQAETLMRKNIRGDVNSVEQSRLLAGIELSRKDTAAALAVYRFAWDQHPDENAYTELLRAYRETEKSKPPEALLQQGLKIFPANPGVLQVVFEAYSTSGTSADLKKALALSERAEKTLWPRSVDWKIRHAETLLALKRKHETEAVLLAALDLMDEDARLGGENGALRQKVFALLETIRK